MNIFSEEEIAKLRSETKGTASVINFNNAGSSFSPNIVVDTMVDYLQEEAVVGAYEIEAKYANEFEHTYELLARLINADKDEIALMENGSTAWGLAFYGIDFKPGDEIITTEMEFLTNAIAFKKIEQTHGVVTRVIPNDDQGDLVLSVLEETISPRTKLIAVTHIASTAANIMPIAEIGKIARKNNILYLIDACQTVGHMPIDVEAIGCDMLAATGRKYLRGPRGTGFLYVRKSVQDSLKLSLLNGRSITKFDSDGFVVRSDARRFELNEKNRALTLGLSKSVEYALNIGIDQIWQRIEFLAQTLRTKLETIDRVTVHDQGTNKSGIVTFSVNSISALEVKKRLFDQRINVSAGPAEFTLVYMNKHDLSSVVRASVHYYNTIDEINTMCTVLSELTI